MRIGVIVATELEQKAFFEVFGPPSVTHPSKSGSFEVSTWVLMPGNSLHLILGGLGEIASASSTQYLIDHFRVDRIINYGVVGGLSEEHTERKVGIVTSVVHYDFDISFGSEYKVGEYPKWGIFQTPIAPAIPEEFTKDLNHFVCASADKIVGGGEPKRRLREQFGADICEMEAAGILITCNRNNIPCTLIKAISDGVDGDVEAFDNHASAAAKNCVELIAELVQKIQPKREEATES